MADLEQYWFGSNSSSEVAEMVARAADVLGLDKVKALLPEPLVLIVQQGDVKSVVVMLTAEGKTQIPAWQGNTGAARSTDTGLSKEVDFVAPTLQKFFEATRDLLASGAKEAEAKADKAKETAQADRKDTVDFYRKSFEPVAEDAAAAAASGVMGTIPAPGAASGDATKATTNEADHDTA